MSIRILLVDDEIDFVEVLAERLKRRGFTVTTAFNGQEALGTIEEGRGPDVVVLDVVMPGLGGIETLREIKKRSPLTEVVMLTGHATVETAIEGMKLGAFDFLMKPTEADELVEKITEAHDHKAAHEERIRAAEIQKIVRRRGW